MLICCPNCGKEIDESLVSCPHCNFIFLKEKPTEEEKVKAIEILLHTRKISIIYEKVLKAINILSLILLGFIAFLIIFYALRSDNIENLPGLYKNAEKTMTAIRVLLITSFCMLFLSNAFGCFKIFFLSPFILKKANATQFDVRSYYKKSINDPTITVDSEDIYLLNTLKYNQYPNKRLPKILINILILACSVTAFVFCYLGFDEILIEAMQFFLHLKEDVSLIPNKEIIIGIILHFGTMIVANLTADNDKTAKTYLASLILNSPL